MGGNAPVFYANFAAASTVPSGLTYTSAGGGYCWNAAGVLVGPLAANTPCFDHNPSTLAALGLRSEPQRTNALHSSGSFGASPGSPGVLPTGWSIAPLNGLVQTVAGTGAESGIPYVDINFAGTTSAAGATVVYYDGTTAIPALTGQTWTASHFAKISGGSVANITGFSFALSEWTSAGVFVSNGGASNSSVPTTAALNTQRQQFSRVLNGGGTTAYVDSTISFSYNSGVAINITLRLSAQIEQNASATSPILTYGTAVMVPADNWPFTGAALAQLLSGKACIAIQILAESPVVAGRVFAVDDGSLNNRLLIISYGSTAAGRFFGIGVNGFALDQYVVGGDQSVSPRTLAFSWARGALPQAAYDGVLMTGQAVAGSPAGMTAAYLGKDGSGGPAFSGWFQQIMIRPSCTAAQVQRYSTAGANLQAENDNDWPVFAANDNLPLIAKIASGERR
jgi:hypothetical protein